MKKVTFTLDDETVGSLERLADRLGMPKSRVVREAIRVYGNEAARLTDEERDELLAAFDETTASIPDRPRRDVESELAAIKRARRRGGRKSVTE